jgi:hypothetical protein
VLVMIARPQSGTSSLPLKAICWWASHWIYFPQMYIQRTSHASFQVG